jgi:hypothetical protein
MSSFYHGSYPCRIDTPLSALMLPIVADGHRFGKENLAVRTHPRSRLNIPVCLIVGLPDKVLLVKTRIRDISEDGGAVFAGLKLVIDSEVQIEYTPPFNRAPLRVRAVVRNRRDTYTDWSSYPRMAKKNKFCSR